VTKVLITGAAEVLRPPEDGLPYLRHDRAGELRLEGGDLMIDGDRIGAFSGDVDLRIDATGCAVLPGKTLVNSRTRFHHDLPLHRNSRRHRTRSARRGSSGRVAKS